jgi:hypothetical protein
MGHSTSYALNTVTNYSNGTHGAHASADLPYAEAAALMKGDGQGSTADFFVWFNYPRLFQFNTWGHLALLAAFVLFQLVPFLFSTVFSIMHVISGVSSSPICSTDAARNKPFAEALAEGNISVRTCMLAMIDGIRSPKLWSSWGERLLKRLPHKQSMPGAGCGVADVFRGPSNLYKSTH